MRLLYFCIGTTVVGLTAGTLALAGRHAQTGEHGSMRATSAVVIELFTSEGCSSCPPADNLLAKLAEQSPAGDVQVIALEEHVDYWNELGWRDAFSSREWTERQSAYASVLGNGNPYTPQMVVDGSAEFVGSHGQQALKSIAEAGQHAKAAVTLSRRASDKSGTAGFTVTVGELPDSVKGGPAEVWLAITESGLHSAVTRGENAGHDLHHAAIVRSMRKIGEAKGSGETSFSGDAAISLRPEWKRENLRAVVFVQERKHLRIIGAAEISLHS